MRRSAGSEIGSRSRPSGWRISAAAAALILGAGAAGCGWSDADDRPQVSAETLETSRFLDIEPLRGEAVVSQGALGDLGVEVVIPDGTRPLAALQQVVSAVGDADVAWDAATCTSSGAILLDGHEQIAGHGNPVLLLADPVAQTLTFAISAATENSDPPGVTEALTTDACAPDERTYLRNLVAD